METVITALTKAEFNARKIAQQYMLMASAYRSRGDLDQAMKQLGKAVKKAPHFADPYLLRGHLHREAGDLVAAAGDYLDCFRRLDGSNATVEALLADLSFDLTRAGLFTDAVRLFQTLAPVAPLSRPSSIAYAIALCGIQQHKEALLVLDHMYPELQSDSLPADVLQLYIRIYEATGAVDQAEGLLLGAVGDNSTSWKALGDFYVRHGKQSKAISAYGEYIARDAETASIDRDARLGSVHKKMGSLFLELHWVDRSGSGAISQAAPTPYLQSAMKHYDAAMMLGAYDRDVRAFYATLAIPRGLHSSSVSMESPAIAVPEAKEASGTGNSDPSRTDPSSPMPISIRASRWVIKSVMLLHEDADRRMSMGGSMNIKMGGSMESLLQSVVEPQTASTAFEQMLQQQEALQ